MPLLQEFKDLRVYQVAVDEATTVFEQTLRFPKAESYALTDQIRRSSRAVSALIAEAWGRRRYPAAFVNGLSQAQAEANETRAWLEHAHRCAYLSDGEYQQLDEAWDGVAGMLYIVQRKAHKFAGPSTNGDVDATGNEM